MTDTFTARHSHGIMRRAAIVGTCTALFAVPAAATTQLDWAASTPTVDRSAASLTSDGLYAASTAPGDRRKVIGKAELARTRATLIAIRTGRYTATVRIRAAVQTADGWKSVGSARVGRPEGWFWFVVSRAEGVCSLAIGENPRRNFEVRLAESTSIGCERGTREFVIRKGDLVRR
jgi:hypothetical protein